jgi:hypothetical protein
MVSVVNERSANKRNDVVSANGGVQFGSNQDSLQTVNFSNNLRGNYSATGRWEDQLFNVVLVPPAIVIITLINDSPDVHTLIYCAKDIDKSLGP